MGLESNRHDADRGVVDDLDDVSVRISDVEGTRAVPVGARRGVERDAVLTHTQHLAGVAKQRMSDWESRYEIVSQVRGLGLLLGVSFRAGREDIEDFHIARSVRDEMLKRGLWAICDNEPQVRMYPALNMAEDVLLEGLSRMEEAIEAVQRCGGVTVGDYPPMPSGNVGF